MATKCCFVLSCVNNSKNNPEKMYFTVPYNRKIRDEWCEAVGRLPNSLKPKSTAYCCSDHFNIETDCDGKTMKKGVTPFIKNLNVESADIVAYTSYVSSTLSSIEDDISEIESSLLQSTLSDPEWLPSSETSSSSNSDIDESRHEDNPLRDLAHKKLELLFQSSIVKNFFGIEPSKMHLVDVIALQANIVKFHILLCLQKIKQNTPFAILAFDYGYSIGHVSKIFRKTISVMAKSLEKFITWSDEKTIFKRLPIAFRLNFRDVDSIIDCFEIEIQRPTNPVHQAHTWSQYKKCNTVKYVVSSTPDGVINFISKGFGGRISDVQIVQSCGYLDALKPNSVVMADRGFKSIETILHKKGCRLVRPPSVSAEEPMTKEEVRETRQIASLRIHIERVIRRYREFAMLRPHATVDTKMLSNLDEVAIVASGLINIQNSLIK